MSDQDTTPTPKRTRTTVKLPREMRERLEDGKRRLADALVGDGVFWIRKIIAEGPARWERDPKTGERFLVDGNADFAWAMTFAADRAGMPRRSEAEITQPGGFTITVQGVGGGLGWPGMAVGGGDAHDERDRPPIAH